MSVEISGVTQVNDSWGDFGEAKLDEIISYVEQPHISLKQAFYNGTTIINNSVTLFALDALGGPCKDVCVEFFLDDDAAATFTPTWYVTRLWDPATFVIRSIPAVATIVTPGADARYQYTYGDLGEGMQLEFRLAQTNAGDATNAVEAVLSYLGV